MKISLKNAIYWTTNLPSRHRASRAHHTCSGVTKIYWLEVQRTQTHSGSCDIGDF